MSDEELMAWLSDAQPQGPTAPGGAPPGGDPDEALKAWLSAPSTPTALPSAEEMRDMEEIERKANESIGFMSDIARVGMHLNQKEPAYNFLDPKGPTQVLGEKVKPNIPLTRAVVAGTEPSILRGEQPMSVAERAGAMRTVNQRQSPDLSALDPAGQAIETAFKTMGDVAALPHRYLEWAAPGKDVPLIPPELMPVSTLPELMAQVVTGAEPTRGPMQKAIAEFSSELTRPSQLLTMYGIAKLPTWAARAMSAYFSADMLKNLVQRSPEFLVALRAGDTNKAIEIGTHLALTGMFAGTAAIHAATPGAVAPKVGEMLPDEYQAQVEANLSHPIPFGQEVGLPGGGVWRQQPDVSYRPASQIPELPERHPILLLPDKTPTTLHEEFIEAQARTKANWEADRASWVSPEERVTTQAPGTIYEAEATGAAVSKAQHEARHQQQVREHLDQQLAELDARALQRGLLFPNQLAEIAKISPELAQERMEAGVQPQPSGYSGEVHDMGGPKPIEKLNPPDHVFRETTEEMLGRPDGSAEAAQAAVENIRPLYGGLLDAEGNPIPITVKVEDVPIASTKPVGDGFEITLPENAPAYQIVHEVSEVAKAKGDPTAETLHDNNAIMAEFTHRATNQPITELHTAPAVTEHLSPQIDAYMKLEDVPLEHPATDVLPGVSGEEPPPFAEPPPREAIGPSYQRPKGANRPVALLMKDGTVYTNPKANTHLELIDEVGLENVKQSGFIYDNQFVKHDPSNLGRPEHWSYSGGKWRNSYSGAELDRLPVEYTGAREPWTPPAEDPTSVKTTNKDIKPLKDAAKKGTVAVEEVPPKLSKIIVAREHLRALAELVRVTRGTVGKFKNPSWDEAPAGARSHMQEWTGGKSKIPEELQQGYEYDKIVEIIEKGLAGEKLAPKQAEYFRDMEKWAIRKDGPLTEQDLAGFLYERNIKATTPEMADLSLDVETRNAEAAGERAAIQGEAEVEPAPDTPPPDTSFEFGMMGAPALGKYGAAIGKALGQEAVRFKRHAGPQTMELLENITKAADTLVKLIDPTKDVDLMLLETMRAGVGALRSVQDPMYNAAIGPARAIKDVIFFRGLESKARFVIAGMKPQQRVAFIDAIRRGDDMSGHPLSPMIHVYRHLSDQLYKAISVLEPDLPYLKNRMSVLWKVAPKETAEQTAMREAWQNARGKNRALLGSLYWKESLKWKSVADGIKNGGIPRTTDIFELMMADLENQTKYLTGNKVWDGLLKYNLRQFIPKDGSVEPKEDWKPIGDTIQNNKLASGWIKVGDENVPGTWFVEPNAYRILENYLSRDPIRQGRYGALGSRIFAMSNSSKAMLLALPLFHASNIFLLSAAALGYSGRVVKKAYTNSVYAGAGAFDPARFMGEVASAMIAGPGRTIQIGNQVRRYFADPEGFLASAAGKEMLEQFPQLAGDLSMFYNSGGRLGYREQYRKGFFNSIRESYHRENSWGGAAIRGVLSVPEILEFIGSPLFGRAIPQAKVATWLLDLQELKTKYAGEYAAGVRDIKTDAGNLWNSVENRFGMVDYDLRFWNRTFKSIMQMSLLSFGWQHGTALMGFNAVWKPISEIQGWLEDVFEPGTGTANVRFGPGSVVSPSRSGGTKIHMIPKAPPKISPDLIDVLKISATVYTINSMIQKAYGNPLPWQTDTPLVDGMVAPRTKGYDEDGKPNRWRFFGSYGPSMVGLYTHFPSHVKNGVSPAIRQWMEAWDNRKFYDHSQIRNVTDPALKQAWDTFLYGAFGSYPFIGGEHGGPIVWQSFKAAKEQGRTTAETASIGAGGGPSPKMYDLTPGEAKIDELLRAEMPYSISKEKAAMKTLETQARERIARGADFSETMDLLSKAARKRASTPSKERNHVRRFKALQLDEALAVWKFFSPEEKIEYGPFLKSKVKDWKPTVSNRGAVHIPTGMTKPHAFDSYSPTQIPVLKDQWIRAMQEAGLQ